MKKCITYIAAILFLCTSMAYAVPILDVKIFDNYIGGNYSSNWAQGQGDFKGDVIALSNDINSFDIDWMKVSIDADGGIVVKIQTDYQDGYGTRQQKTNYGDLFVSTDRWSPYDGLKDDDNQSVKYKTDTKYNGEDWEYALNTSSKNIYKIDDSRNNSKVLTSNNVMSVNSSWYRTDQEVLYDPEDGEETAGSFVFSHNDDLISYDFNLSALGINWENGLDLGFHWTMTCANDVIEGGVSMAPVPEPGTMLLLGFGLLGLGAVGRKHYPQK